MRATLPLTYGATPSELEIGSQPATHPSTTSCYGVLKIFKL